MSWRSSWGGYPPYVRVAERKKQAATKVAKLKKKGQNIHPIVIEGKNIATTFWGKAWCKNLESYSDYDNRLPRGRSYVRHGAVIDLKLQAGKVSALVNGSSFYTVEIEIAPLPDSKWDALLKECAGKIDSLIELLQGTFSKSMMEKVTHREKGLFPNAEEIKLSCSCYDWADMCKHVAAVLYGVGARLDEHPEDLFLLRHVKHEELLTQASAATLSDKHPTHLSKPITGDLSALFGIEIEETPQKPPTKTRKPVKKQKNS